MYLDKLEVSKNEFEEYKVAARENEKHVQGDKVKTRKEIEQNEFFRHRILYTSSII